MSVSTDQQRWRWDAISPADAAALFSGLQVPWWIAGGWAIDLFLGQRTRHHGDLDIGVLRRDVMDVLSMLTSWEIFEAERGVLTRIASDALPRAAVNSLWCRRGADEPWLLELMLDESHDDEWVYRRHASVRRKLNEVVRRGAAAVPYLAPEVQLLYKSKCPRFRDEADFNAAVPRLSDEARTWFHRSLVATNPLHHWIGRINDGSVGRLPDES